MHHHAPWLGINAEATGQKAGHTQGKLEARHYPLESLLLLFSHEVVSDSATLWTAAHQASLSFTVSQSLFKLMSTESVTPSCHRILCLPLFLLPSISPSVRVFSSELALHSRWPKYWRFNFRISPSNEYSELISFRIDWFALLAVQGTLKSLLQHHNSKASIFGAQPSLCSVQLLYPYIITGEIIALTVNTFVRKVMSLLFNRLFRFPIAFPPRSKCLLISWLQSLSTVILEPKKIKSVTVSTFPPSICLEMMGPDAVILVFWMLNFKPALSLFYPHQENLQFLFAFCH